MICYDPQSTHNAMLALYRFSPYAFIAILPVALFIEWADFSSSPYSYHSNFKMFSELIGLVCFAGILAFMLILLEVKLVQLTSSLTLGVIGQLVYMYMSVCVVYFMCICVCMYTSVHN